MKVAIGSFKGTKPQALLNLNDTKFTGVLAKAS